MATSIVRGRLLGCEGRRRPGGSVHQAAVEGLAVMVRESVARAALLCFCTSVTVGVIRVSTMATGERWCGGRGVGPAPGEQNVVLMLQSRGSRFAVMSQVVRGTRPVVYDARGLTVYSFAGEKGLRNGGNRPYSGPRGGRGRAFGPGRARGGGVLDIHRKEVALGDYGRWRTGRGV